MFKAWTEAERLAQWWGPKNFTILVSKLDLRPGGVFHYCMRSPDGRDMWGKFVYREIAAPERLVFVNSLADEKGNVAPNPWIPHWPLEVLSTLTLEEHQGRTTVTLRGTALNATELERKAFADGRKSMQQGLKGNLGPTRRLPGKGLRRLGKTGMAGRDARLSSDSGEGGVAVFSVPWYICTMVNESQLLIERVQTGVRMEKRLLKVLKALAEYHDMSLGDLLEGIVLHAFDGKVPFGSESLKRIHDLKKFYALDLDSSASHHLTEIKLGPGKKKSASRARK